MKLHKLCTLFPEDTKAIDSIVKSMKEIGYDKTEPIITYKGEILDGRHRSKAAEIAGVKPIYKKFKDGDPFEFVIRKNLSRRHLDKSQLAAIAAEMANITRHDFVGNRYSRVVENDDSKISDAEAAAIFNIGATTVKAAKRVKREDPEFFKLIKDGKKTVNAWKAKMKKQKELEEKKAAEAAGKIDDETSAFGDSCENYFDEILVVFGIDIEKEKITEEAVKILTNGFAKKYHPDMPDGDAEKMILIIKAKNALMEEFLQ